MIDEQHNHRADDRADQARALIGPVPAECLPEPGCDEGADNAEYAGQYEALRIVRRRRYPARDQAGDEADDDDPDVIHAIPLRGLPSERDNRAAGFRVKRLQARFNAIPRPAAFGQGKSAVAAAMAEMAACC